VCGWGKVNIWFCVTPFPYYAARSYYLVWLIPVVFKGLNVVHIKILLHVSNMYILTELGILLNTNYKRPKAQSNSKYWNVIQIISSLPTKERCMSQPLPQALKELYHSFLWCCHKYPLTRILLKKCCFCKCFNFIFYIVTWTECNLFNIFIS
jgi:hypothetical protein